MSENAEHDTLLAHLAWMFACRHEDIAVEALGYILQSESARRALVKLAQDAGAVLDTISQVHTQVIGDDASRPDLTCTDQCGKDCLVIEAKFWASLTRNQPNAYLDQLSQGKGLLFIAPGKRIDVLWAELQERTSSYGSLSTSETRLGEVRSLRTRENKHLMLTSWDHLLDHLENSVGAQQEAEIQQLRGLTAGAETIVAGKLVPVGPNELDLAGLVRDAAAGAAAAGCASTSGLRATRRPTGYGKYLLVADAGAWLGVDTEHWRYDSGPNTPLWLHFERWTAELSVSFCQVFQAFKAHGKSDAIIDDKNVYVPLPLPKEVRIDHVIDFVKPFKGSNQVQPFPYPVPYEEVLRKVVDVIKEVARVIRSG